MTCDYAYRPTATAHGTSLDPALVAQATRRRAEQLAQQARGNDCRTLCQLTVLVAGERRTWYSADFTSERYGTTDHWAVFDSLPAAQAAYDQLF